MNTWFQQRTRYCRLAVWLGAVLLLAGCGESGISISGTAKVGGQPIQKGKFSLVPMTGVDSPSAMGPIVNGKFSLGPEAHLKNGKFDVTVIITPERPPRSKSVRKNINEIDLAAEMAKAMKEAGPANENFSVQIEISDSSTQFDFDFEK